jgi:hypothetical protein
VTCSSVRAVRDGRVPGGSVDGGCAGEDPVTGVVRFGGAWFGTVVPGAAGRTPWSVAVSAAGSFPRPGCGWSGRDVRSSQSSRLRPGRGVGLWPRSGSGTDDRVTLGLDRLDMDRLTAGASLAQLGRGVPLLGLVGETGARSCSGSSSVPAPAVATESRSVVMPPVSLLPVSVAEGGWCLRPGSASSLLVTFSPHGRWPARRRASPFRTPPKPGLHPASSIDLASVPGSGRMRQAGVVPPRRSVEDQHRLKRAPREWRLQEHFGGGPVHRLVLVPCGAVRLVVSVSALPSPVRGRSHNHRAALGAALGGELSAQAVNRGFRSVPPEVVPGHPQVTEQGPQ